MDDTVKIKLPSVDSFDEDTQSDVDDEVFIKSSRNSFRNPGRERKLQKPLMAPRKKCKQVYIVSSLSIRTLIADIFF